MEIRVLFNHRTGYDYLLPEFGWSCLIDNEILFDTGSDPGILAENMRRMDVHPRKVKDIVLSHEHWDHIDGLPVLFRDGSGTRVHVPSCFSEYARESIMEMGGVVAVNSGLFSIRDSYYLSDEFDFTILGESMCEQMLVAETVNGLVLVVGCSHPGILRMMQYAVDCFPEKKIHAVVGGLHLVNRDRHEIEEVIDGFRAMEVERVAATHCTGELAEEMFLREFRGAFRPAGVGDVLRF